MVKRDCLFLLLLFSSIALFSVFYYALEKRKKEKLVGAVAVVGAVVCCFAFLYLAVFSRKPREVETELWPFWSYLASVSRYYALDVFFQIVENIAIFIPIGFLLPFAFGGGARGVKKAIALSFFLSFFAEASQLVFSLGVCETDDLLNNTLGAAVGAGLYVSLISARIENGALVIKNEKSFLKGLLPLLSVYELSVLLAVLREALN